MNNCIYYFYKQPLKYQEKQDSNICQEIMEIVVKYQHRHFFAFLIILQKYNQLTIYQQVYYNLYLIILFKEHDTILLLLLMLILPQDLIIFIVFLFSFHVIYLIIFIYVVFLSPYVLNHLYLFLIHQHLQMYYFILMFKFFEQIYQINLKNFIINFLIIILFNPKQFQKVQNHKF